MSNLPPWHASRKGFTHVKCPKLVCVRCKCHACFMHAWTVRACKTSNSCAALLPRRAQPSIERAHTALQNPFRHCRRVGCQLCSTANSSDVIFVAEARSIPRIEPAAVVQFEHDFAHKLVLLWTHFVQGSAANYGSSCKGSICGRI